MLGKIEYPKEVKRMKKEDKLVIVRSEVHRRLKIRAAEEGKNLVDLTHELLATALGIKANGGNNGATAEERR